jgi:anti-anti-sigma factor
LTITQTQEGQIHIFTLAGRLDTNTAPELQAKLIPVFDTAKEVILDFTDIAYVSSAGLRVLLMGHKTAKAAKSTMALRNVSEEVTEVLEMTGFLSMLTVI